MTGLTQIALTVRVDRVSVLRDLVQVLTQALDLGAGRSGVAFPA